MDGDGLTSYDTKPVLIGTKSAGNVHWSPSKNTIEQQCNGIHQKYPQVSLQISSGVTETAIGHLAALLAHEHIMPRLVQMSPCTYLLFA